MTYIIILVTTLSVQMITVVEDCDKGQTDRRAECLSRHNGMHETIRRVFGRTYSVAIVPFPCMSTLTSSALLPRLHPGSVVFAEDPRNPRAILHALGKG